MSKRKACRSCGCTQSRACLDRFERPCFWVEPDLCSNCVPAGVKAVIGLQLRIDMLGASCAMMGEYVCDCGTAGDDRTAIEGCKERPCGFRDENGAVDAPYLDEDDLKRERKLFTTAQSIVARCNGLDARKVLAAIAGNV